MSDVEPIEDTEANPEDSVDAEARTAEEEQYFPYSEMMGEPIYWQNDPTNPASYVYEGGATNRELGRGDDLEREDDQHRDRELEPQNA